MTESYMKDQVIEDFFPRANFVSENVVRDKNVITAIGRCFVDFAIEIADYFGVFDNPENNFSKESLANSYKGL